MVQLSIDGDESAFAEIVRRYTPRVFQFASRYFRERSQVEDAAQEVFLKAYTQLKSYEGRGSFEGWLTRITTNTCLNMIRSTKRRPEMTVSDLTEDENSWIESAQSSVSNRSEPSIENKIVAADLADKVLETLSPDDRLVLTMIEGEEASIKDVAEATGWSESNVKVKAFRARSRMREAVEKLLKIGKRRKQESAG